jgi:spore coat polysaccharide biosynthesis protein SpsF (cytidylyltransferase family)/aryl-alcohol dehydrogenase-like predicted oxidoreductase
LVNRVRIILQARTTSRRLPAKVLLPIAGLPLAVLCALRLRSTGLELVLATSSEESDDILVAVAQKWGLRIVRGSLDNVFDRFLTSTQDLADSDLVVRATADNPLPDGMFVEDLLGLFKATKRNYLGTSSPDDGLPFGLSAEVFYVGALRQVATVPVDVFDQEHVTRSLRKQAGANGVVARDSFITGDLSHLRATVDTLEDYLAMAKTFADVDHPTTVEWRHLLARLPSNKTFKSPIPTTFRSGEAYGALTLGTAQLGSHYGVTNRSGQPNDSEAAKIVALALRAGVTHFDTARAYGNAEERLGNLIMSGHLCQPRLVTKLSPLESIPKGAHTREVRSAVEASVYGSCRDLRASQLDVLMFHRSGDMLRWNGAATTCLDELRKRGVIGALGCSLYSPGEAAECIADHRIEHIQIPFNLVDSRWLKRDFLQQLTLRPDLQVHVRSVFLQGLLINEAEYWPPWFLGRFDIVGRIRSLVRDFQRKSPADLCIAYVRSFQWITSLVLGVETVSQLEELIPLFSEPTLDKDQIRLVQLTLEGIPERLLNPSEW